MRLSDQETVILAILSETDRYGYEIDKILTQRQIRPWGDIAVSSIYAVLRRLHRKGLVESREVSQSGRPPRKLYSISDSGRVVLESNIFESILDEERLIGRFEIVLLVWPMLFSENRNELLSSYMALLRTREEFYRQEAGQTINPISAALFERPLRTVMAEIGWLKEFAQKNGVLLIDE
jgi:DNA-binding PadR family transcriptional regulator